MPFWQYAGIFRELKGLSHEELIAKLPDVLETFFGQCRLALDHRGTMVLCPDDPNTFIAGVSPQIDNIGCSNSSDYSTLTVCAPGDVGDTTIDNTNGDSLPPIVEGGFSGVFCGPVFNDTTISNNFYVDIDNFYFYDNVNFTTKVITIITANQYSFTVSGDHASSVTQEITDGQTLAFRGKTSGPISCKGVNADIMEIEDSGKLILSSNDTTFQYFEDKAKDSSVYESDEDLKIYYYTEDDGGDENARWFINSDTIASYNKTSVQLLGHHSDGSYKWYNVEECS